MKRFVLLFFISLIAFAWNGKAQDVFNDFIQAPLGSKVSVDAGYPVVFVPPYSNSKEKFVPEPVLWKPDVGLVQITSFAGQTLQVPNITHIPSLFVYVQVLPDKSVVVTERIPLVLNTQQTAPFVRSYPLILKDIKGTPIVREVKFLWARYNFETIIPSEKKLFNEQAFSFFDDVGLASGVHLFELSYLVPNAVFVEGNISRLFLPILGLKLPYLIENMQILVTYPSNTPVLSAKAFFGQNNQTVEKAYSVYQNEKEHLVYKINGLVPAFADVRLEVLGQAKGFTTYSISEKINDGVFNYNGLIFALFVSLILFLYFHFSALDLKDKSIESAYLAKIRNSVRYDVGTLRYLVLKKIDVQTIFSCVIYLFLKKDVDIRLNAQNQIILLRQKNIKSFDNRLLGLIMSSHSRLNIENTSLSITKMKHFIFSHIRWQIFKMVRREVFVAVLLMMSSIFIAFYLNHSLIRFLMAIIIIVTAFVFSFIHFIRKGDFKKLLKDTFMYYADLPRADEKKLPFDIALERKIPHNLKLEINGKEIAINEFEKMFLTQLKGIKK